VLDSGKSEGPSVQLTTPSEPSIGRQLGAIPNLLTYVRILAIPAFLWAYLRGDAGLALVLFIGAAATDGLDGFLARVLRQQTRLGEILDPVADKALTLAAAGVLVVHGRIPVWLLGLVLLRDGAIAVAVAVLRWSRRRLPNAPTRFGKYATFTLAAALTFALVHEATNDPVWDSYMAVAALLALQCVAITIVQYFARWRRLMLAPP
jgi:cardiolipin synthase